MRAYAVAAILSCYISLIVCAPADSSAVSDHIQHQTRLTGRSPSYNFGLGKRSYSPYSFGLGKRSENFDYDDDLQLAEQLLSNWESARLIDSNNDMPSDYEVESYRGMFEPKRSRPYSFGLGKRARAYDFGLDALFAVEFKCLL
uniref:CSON015386 protein n=1 Tax=Culicoides sonorensis TaxID=179676 RepID=A0A336MHC7_CULSO